MNKKLFWGRIAQIASIAALIGAIAILAPAVATAFAATEGFALFTNTAVLLTQVAPAIGLGIAGGVGAIISENVVDSAKKEDKTEVKGATVTPLTEDLKLEDKKEKVQTASVEKETTAKTVVKSTEDELTK